MTVLGENPGEEIIVNLSLADAGGGTYAWYTGLSIVNSAVAAVENAGAELVTSIAASTVTIGGTTNEKAVYAIAMGW